MLVKKLAYGCGQASIPGFQNRGVVCKVSRGLNIYGSSSVFIEGAGEQWEESFKL